MKLRRNMILAVALLVVALGIVACGTAEEMEADVVDDGTAAPTVQGGDVEQGGVEFGEELESDIEQGSVEEGGELGDVEVTAGARGPAPTAELQTPETLGGEDTTEGIVVGEEEEDQLAGPDTEGEEPPFTSYETFADDLRVRGVEVEQVGEMDDPEMGVNAQTLRVNGEEVLVYQFESAGEAEAEAQRISEGDTTTEVEALITEGTHVFQQGDIIAIYTGGNADIYGALAAVLGDEVGM